VSGFGTVGTSTLNAPAGWVYKREISQSVNNGAFDLDSRLGLQLNYTASENIELVGQAIIRRRAAGAPAADAIEWAFAAYRPNADWALRMGRINTDLFIMSDHRNVGFAYLYARPPLEFYAAIPSSLDGADLTRTWKIDNALWQAKVYVGQSDTTAGGSAVAEARQNIGLIVSREVDGLLLRISLLEGLITIKSESVQLLLNGLDDLSKLPVPQVAEQAKDLYSHLHVTNNKHSYASIGARYVRSDWLLSGEIAHVTGNIYGVSSGYASVGRSFGPITVYGISSRMNSRSAPAETPDWATPLTPLGPQVAQQAQFIASAATSAINGYAIRQKAVSAGGRWDLNSKLALKIQWDRIRIRASGSALWGNASHDPASANVASAMLDFVF
jgi:hypothetical protein